MRRVRTALLLTPLLCLVLWAAVTQPLFSVPEIHAPAADPARLEAQVRALCQRFYPRSFDGTRLDATAAYLHAELQTSGGLVRDEIFEVDGERYRNVVARFGPAKGRVIVVGAHYDTISDGRTSPPRPASHTPGADDNASGVAGLLELARLLGQHPPAVPVELVAYTLEEPPFFGTESMGSAVHARRLHERGEAVEVMVALEMIGYYTDAADSQRYPLPGMGGFYPDRGNFIAVVGRFQDMTSTRHFKAALRGASDLPVRSMDALALLPGMDFSDHRNYWAEGDSAVMITDTAFYRNRAYHGATDTPERLDYRRMAQVVTGVLAGIQSYTQNLPATAH